jgi:hypothetical protein
MNIIGLRGSKHKHSPGFGLRLKANFWLGRRVGLPISNFKAGCLVR